MDDPKTPPKIDDCLMVDDQTLDASYVGQAAISKFSGLIHNHKETMQQLERFLSISSLEKKLRSAGDIEFGSRL